MKYDSPIIGKICTKPMSEQALFKKTNAVAIAVCDKKYLSGISTGP